ncbi:hypothetical protein AMTR_s00059p00125680 [Amborella trichopoda]|uniref:Major facilitator superfamily (MFS) profile domain-containing protein n=1 Tax=Amborella trichopoda TaxID=13333 RepID=U5CW79_AMBTC|nr:hypothetical protein AMTR_s00059p00125680 [Amborella trichopoda]
MIAYWVGSIRPISPSSRPSVSCLDLELGPKCFLGRTDLVHIQVPLCHIWGGSGFPHVTCAEDIGVISGAQLFVSDDLHLSDIKLEVVIGAINLFAIPGSALGGVTSNWLGRRRTLMLSSALFTIASIVMSVAPSFAVLLLGRFLAGAAAGLALVTAPIYASEIASPEVRGALASLTEIFMGIGILFGYISNNVLAPLPRSYNWRVMLGLSALPALIIFVLLIFIPETPRWLVMRGRQGEARKVLLMTSNGDVEVAEQRLAEIECAAKVEESSVRWGELLSRPSPCVLRMLFAAIGVNFFQQASGIQAVTLYAPKIFVRAGMKKKSQV